jgi:hypothetical protein
MPTSPPYPPGRRSSRPRHRTRRVAPWSRHRGAPRRRPRCRTTPVRGTGRGHHYGYLPLQDHPAQFGPPGRAQFGPPGPAQFGPPGPAQFGPPGPAQFGPPGPAQFVAGAWIPQAVLAAGPGRSGLPRWMWWGPRCTAAQRAPSCSWPWRDRPVRCGARCRQRSGPFRSRRRGRGRCGGDRALPHRPVGGIGPGRRAAAQDQGGLTRWALVSGGASATSLAMWASRSAPGPAGPSPGGFSSRVPVAGAGQHREAGGWRAGRLVIPVPLLIRTLMPG